MKKEIPRDEFIRKRMERQKRIRKRRLIIFFIFFFVMMICVGITLSLTVFFKIEKINAVGSEIYSSEEIIKHSGIEIGENLFTLSQSDTERTLKKTLPYVETVKIKRDLSGIINLKVTDAVEFACYNVNGRFYTVSDNGWVLKETSKKPKKLVEIITPDAECKVGSEISFKKEKPSEIINEITSALKEVNLKPNKIDVSDSVSLTIRVENRFDVKLGTKNNIPEKIKQLSGMIKHIPDKKTGNINLSMWTSSNTEGIFTPDKEK